jgi:hypothetical protein
MWAEALEAHFISNPFKTKIVFSISSAEISKCVTNRIVGPKDEQRIPFSFNERMIEFLISSEATSIMIMLVTTDVTFFTHSN